MSRFFLIFIQKSFTSWHHQTNKDVLLCRFQSTSWYFWECVFIILLSCFSFSFRFCLSISLSLSLSLVLLLNIICFQKSFPAILFSLLLNLPRADKRVETKKKKKEKQRRSAASHHHFGFVVVLLKNNALLTFPLCYVFNNFNRTNRLGKRPSSLASCTTNSTPRTKRRSASIFYRKRYIWRILEAFDYNCGIPLARSDFDR